jgi:hypothetical protein
MIPIDHRRAIATGLIREASARLAHADLKDLSVSDRKMLSGALKKLATVAASLSRTTRPGDDDAAAKLAAVSAVLTNCKGPDFKLGASQLNKAAKIFDDLSQGL